MSRQFSGEQEFYPSRSGGAIGGDRKAATGLVYQELGLTIAITGASGALILQQASGLNADDVIINAAVVYVNGLGGGSLFIEQGDYTIAASIIPTGPIRIYGSGVDTTIDGGNVAHVFDINNLWDIHIDHIALRTNPGGGFLFNPINIRGNSLRICIATVSILASDNDGIAITIGVTDVCLYNLRFTTIDNYPINCDGSDCSIYENHFSGAIGNDGIFLDANSAGNVVVNNFIHAWTGEPIDDDGNNTVETNVCCVAGAFPVAWNSKGCGFATIQAAIDHQAGNGKITIEDGNFAVAAGVIALDAADSSLEIVGAGFLVTNLSSVAATGPCIDINACINVRISHLSVATTGVGANDAIQIRGISVAIDLKDIACQDSGQDALSIAVASNNVHIHSCYFFGDITRYGINNAGDDCIITDNRISGTGNDGIWLQAGGTYCICAENRIDDWGGEAIDWDEPTCQVAHNVTAV